MAKKQKEETLQEKVVNKTSYYIGYACGKVNRIKENIDVKEMTEETKKYTSKVQEWSTEFVNDVANMTGELSESFKDGLNTALNEGCCTTETTKKIPAKKTKSTSKKKTTSKKASNKEEDKKEKNQEEDKEAEE